MFGKNAARARIIAAITLLCGFNVNNGFTDPPKVWNGLGTNNELTDGANWLPSGTPTSLEHASFNNLIADINTSLTATLADFSVDSINFTNSASAFTFTFDNHMLTLTGVGITGTYTNTTMFFNNINNVGTITANFELTSTDASSTRNAAITMINSATLSGDNTGRDICDLSDHQVLVSGPFSLPSNVHWTGINAGNNLSTSGGGNNTIAIIGYQNSHSQVTFQGTFSLGDNSTFSFFNEGIDQSSSSAEGNNVVAYIGGSQGEFNQGVTLGNNVEFSFSNSGTERSGAIGNSNYAGYIGSNQVEFNDSLAIGDNAAFSLSNVGDNESNNGGDNLVGNLLSRQILVSGTLSIGNNTVFSVSNNGNEQSNSSGNNYVGYIGSEQAEFDGTLFVGDNSTFLISNTGNNQDTAGGNNHVGDINSEQVTFSGAATLGNNVTFSVSNSGNDQSTSGIGENNTAVIGYQQVSFDDTLDVGNNVVFSIFNSGTIISTNLTNPSYTGYVQEGAVSVSGTFTAGHNLAMSATNYGLDRSTGVGGNETGYIDSGAAQLEFHSDVSVGDNATITIKNSGTSTANTITNNQTRTGIVTDGQFSVGGSLTAGDHFSVRVTNTGEDFSSGTDDHVTGVISAPQFVTGTVNLAGKDHATFIVENSGIYGGSTSGSNTIGLIDDNQMVFNGDFTTGDFLTITAANYGKHQGIPTNSSSAIGFVAGSQLTFEGACSIGDDAIITISNSGSFTTGTLDQVGVIRGNQFLASQAFTAGEHLTINVTNNATVSSTLSIIGLISGTQIDFAQNFTSGDGCFLSASNLGAGVVSGSQISFEQQCNINGSATFQSINEGTVGGYGIEIRQGTGGDVNIVLENSSLYVSSPAADFTIGALNGDSTSVVQSAPLLIIDTDASVNAAFSGIIKDFSSASSLIKTGVGAQKLSGLNTFTGTTTLHAGTLILTGSLSGPLNIDGNGILKGTGYVAGDVASVGTISPGESIGTIHFLSNFANGGGNYEVEVNGAGDSDLIQVAGNADITGGVVIVSSVDGTYKFQDRYTILETTTGIHTGQFLGVTAISSLVQPFLSEDLQHIYLTLYTNIEAVAETPNQLAIATLLDGIIDPNDQQNLVLSEIVELPSNEARGALDSLSGYQHAADLITSMMINRQFIRRLYDPLRSIVSAEPGCCSCHDNSTSDCCHGDQDFTTWIDVGGTFMKVHGHQQDPGLNTQGYNIASGIQKTFCENWTVGIAGGYEQDRLNFKHSGGLEKCNTWLVGLYGLYRPSCFYGLVDFVYGNSSNHMNRSINVGTLHYEAKSSPDVQQYTFYGELGTDFDVYNTLIQPFIGFEAGKYHRQHVKESFANGWGLEVNKRNHSLTTTRLGVHITTNNIMDCGASLSLDLAWNYMTSGLKNHINERFNEFGSPFTIEYTPLNRNSFNYGITFSIPFEDGFRVYFEGVGESWIHTNVFDVLGGLEYCW